MGLRIAGGCAPKQKVQLQLASCLGNGDRSGGTGFIMKPGEVKMGEQTRETSGYRQKSPGQLLSGRDTEVLPRASLCQPRGRAESASASVGISQAEARKRVEGWGAQAEILPQRIRVMVNHEGKIRTQGNRPFSGDHFPSLD